MVGECISRLLSALCIHLPPRLSATPPSPEGGEWEYYRLGGKHPKEVGTEDDAKCERRTITKRGRSYREA
ncbi:MAG: hypothetical protein KH403_17840 [Bacteroides caccae]|nr:hypothetical protein [Bacteroides caccae]